MQALLGHCLERQLRAGFEPSVEVARQLAVALAAPAAGDEIDESIDHINTALKLSPGNQEYILHLAGFLYFLLRCYNKGV